jgi:hypothetical protein
MTETPEQRQHRELSAWESATAQNLDPLLDADAAKTLWAAIVKNRKAPSADEFAKAVTGLAGTDPARIAHVTRSINALRTLVAGFSAATAAKG